MNRIFWLASYPKSGNTWMRAFLSNYGSDAEQPVDINNLNYTLPVSDRQIFDEILSMDTGNLRQDELDYFRPSVYRRLAGKTQTQQSVFWKIHDAFQRLPDGEPIFPQDLTGGVVYIVRSPLDVAVSYAYHSGISIDQAINWMADREHGLFNLPVRLYQVHQRMLSWSEHVLSWTEQTDLPLIFTRYEDMTFNPLPTFTKVIEFVRAAYPDVMIDDMGRIERALRFSSFDELQKQEHKHGFVEKDQRAATFFRKGKVGDWRNRLTSEQVQRILNDHGAVMRQYGYLTESGEIVEFG